jgi:hypothetical protein
MIRLLKRAWAWLLSGQPSAKHNAEHSVIANRRSTIAVEFVEELPEIYRLNTLYVVGETNSYWCATMRCPCGCDESIHLSLLKHDNPSWKLQVDRSKRPTLVPSVWRSYGCQSHFFLRRGQVIWCQNQRRTKRFNNCHVYQR